MTQSAAPLPRDSGSGRSCDIPIEKSIVSCGDGDTKPNWCTRKGQGWVRVQQESEDSERSCCSDVLLYQQRPAAMWGAAGIYSRYRLWLQAASVTLIGGKHRKYQTFDNTKCCSWVLKKKATVPRSR